MSFIVKLNSNMMAVSKIWRSLSHFILLYWAQATRKEVCSTCLRQQKLLEGNYMSCCIRIILSTVSYISLLSFWHCIRFWAPYVIKFRFMPQLKKAFYIFVWKKLFIIWHILNGGIRPSLLLVDLQSTSDKNVSDFFFRTRLLRANLLQPLKDIGTINTRLDCLVSVDCCIWHLKLSSGATKC